MSDVEKLVQAAYAGAVYDGSQETMAHLKATTALPPWFIAAQAAEDKKTGGNGSFPRCWAEWEEEYLAENLGLVPLWDIAAHLGRTEAALRIRLSRKGMTAPTKREDVLTSRQVGSIMGVDVHVVVKWVERGYLRGRVLLIGGGRYVWRIWRYDVKRFIVSPRNFAYFDPERIADREIRRLALLARERHGNPEYLTTGQVAKIHRVTDQRIANLIRRGRLPAVRWGNWLVQREDAEALELDVGRGKGYYQANWRFSHTLGALRFMVMARGMGLPYTVIAEMMGHTRSQDSAVQYRLGIMHQSGELAAIVGELPGVHMSPGEAILGDWLALERRFPTVARAIWHFLDGERLGGRGKGIVRRYLGAVIDYRLVGPEWERTARGLRFCNRTCKVEKLWKVYGDMRRRGVDLYRVFGGDEDG